MKSIDPAVSQPKTEGDALEASVLLLRLKKLTCFTAKHALSTSHSHKKKQTISTSLHLEPEDLARLLRTELRAGLGQQTPYALELLERDEGTRRAPCHAKGPVILPSWASTCLKFIEKHIKTKSPVRHTHKTTKKTSPVHYSTHVIVRGYKGRLLLLVLAALLN